VQKLQNIYILKSTTVYFPRRNWNSLNPFSCQPVFLSSQYNKREETH